MRKIVLHIALVLGFSIISIPCISQNSQFVNTRFYAQQQGLSNYNIHKIIQDDKNFLWIATQDGLNRFDGNEFIVFNRGLAQKKNIFSNDIRDIFFDSSRNIIWVICNEGGVNGIDIKSATVKYNIPYSTRNPYAEWRICASYSNDRIYIGTSGGIEIFNCRRMAFEPEPFNPALFYRKDIRSLNIDRNGHMWVGALNNGMYLINLQGNKMIAHLEASDFKQSAAGEIFWPLCGTWSEDSLFWLGTKTGLYKIHCGQTTDAIKIIPLQNTILQTFQNQEISHLIYRNHELVIPGNNLYKYNVRSGSLNPIVAIEQSANVWLTNITYCFEDSQQNTWVGCRQGLGLLKKGTPPFLPVKSQQIPGDRLGHVYAICALDDKHFLIGIKDGLYLFSRPNVLKKIFEGSLVQNIFRLTGNTNILISGSRGSLLFDGKKILPLEKRFPELGPYKQWQFNSKIVLNDSIIILASETNSGILRWNIRQHHVENILQSADGLASNIVNSVFLTGNQQAVVLSDFALTLLSNSGHAYKKIVFPQKETGEPMGIFMEMSATKDNYWIAAYGQGLLKLDKNFNLQKTYRLEDGLSNTGLYKIFNFRDSLLLLSSNNGISVFDINRNIFRRYYQEDGLQNNTFEEACGDTANGLFFAGGVDGFVSIDPTKIQSSFTHPVLRFTRFHLLEPGNRFVDESCVDTDTVLVSPDALQANIYFSGIFYENPLNVTYSYRINEIKNEWINIGTQRFISLTGLSPGNYHLQVQAFSEEGLASEIRELTIVFIPKWYQTWWFKMLCVLATISIAYIFYRMRIAQLKKEEQIRSKLASDLHDDLGSTLNSVKVYANLAIMEKGESSYLNQVKESTQEAISGLRDLIWVLDDKKDAVDHLINRIGQFAIPLCGANSISFTPQVDQQAYDIKLGKEERRNLYMIIKESINNSIKYADCTRIELQIFSLGKYINIKIADNGKGFDDKKIVYGNGIRNIQTRAKIAGYRVNITSAEGRGTIIFLEKQ